MRPERYQSLGGASNATRTREGRPCEPVLDVRLHSEASGHSQIHRILPGWSDVSLRFGVERRTSRASVPGPKVKGRACESD